MEVGGGGGGGGGGGPRERGVVIEVIVETTSWFSIGSNNKNELHCATPPEIMSIPALEAKILRSQRTLG